MSRMHCNRFPKIKKNNGKFPHMHCTCSLEIKQIQVYNLAVWRLIVVYYNLLLLRYYKTNVSVGSWHRLVNVALIPRFLDAGWRGWPPRFHTVVTCAHRAVWCGLGIFPSTSSVILSDCGRAAAQLALAKSIETCRARMVVLCCYRMLIK